MTEIESIYHNDTFYLSIQGHSGYAEVGKDIVCSAVTILAFSIKEFLDKCETEGKIFGYMFDAGDGYMSFICNVKEDYKKEISVTLSAICNGFDILSKNYEKNVHFSPKGNIFDY